MKRRIFNETTTYGKEDVKLDLGNGHKMNLRKRERINYKNLSSNREKTLLETGKVSKQDNGININATRKQFNDVRPAPIYKQQVANVESKKIPIEQVYDYFEGSSDSSTDGSAWQYQIDLATRLNNVFKLNKRKQTNKCKQRNARKQKNAQKQTIGSKQVIADKQLEDEQLQAKQLQEKQLQAKLLQKEQLQSDEDKEIKAKTGSNSNKENVKVKGRTTRRTRRNTIDDLPLRNITNSLRSARKSINFMEKVPVVHLERSSEICKLIEDHNESTRTRINSIVNDDVNCTQSNEDLNRFECIEDDTRCENDRMQCLDDDFDIDDLQAKNTNDDEISKCFGFDYHDDRDSRNNSNASWRVNLPFTRNPYWFKYKSTNHLPNQEQEPIIDYSFTERLEKLQSNSIRIEEEKSSTNSEEISLNNEGNRRLTRKRKTNLVQKTINDFFDVDNLNEDAVETYEQNTSLFDVDALSPLKMSTPLIERRWKRNLLSKIDVLAENQEFNIVHSTTRKESLRLENDSIPFGRDSSRVEEVGRVEEASSRVEKVSSRVVDVENDLSSTFFSDDKENRQRTNDTNQKPTRFELKVYVRSVKPVKNVKSDGKKNVSKIVNVKEPMPLTSEELSELIGDEDEQYDLDHYKFFEDLPDEEISGENEEKLKKKTNNKKRKMDERSGCDTSDENLNSNKKNRREVKKKRVKENPEYVKWAKRMNTQFAEIDKHDLEFA